MGIMLMRGRHDGAVIILVPPVINLAPCLRSLLQLKRDSLAQGCVSLRNECLLPSHHKAGGGGGGWGL